VDAIVPRLSHCERRTLDEGHFDAHGSVASASTASDANSKVAVSQAVSLPATVEHAVRQHRSRVHGIYSADSVLFDEGTNAQAACVTLASFLDADRSCRSADIRLSGSCDFNRKSN